MPRFITPAELHARMTAGGRPLLVDVRSPAEHAAIHVPGVLLMPLDQLDPGALPTDQGVIHLLCQGGGRATRAAERLDAAGIPCCVVSGGTRAWAEAGLPVNRGRGVIALERQVRIVAGGLVLLGVVLGATMHPWCFGLSGFVGAGLVFAGITDWCGMGLLLARAPWNSRAVAPAAGSAPSCPPT